MALQCLCGKENSPDSMYCGGCGRLLSEVEVEPDLQAKIRSVVANQLNRRSRDKNSVELEIAANAFEMARRWLIASFAFVILVFGYLGWSFHSFVKETKETISQDQTEIETYKHAVEQEKEKLLGKIEKLDGEIEALSKKVKQQKLDIFVNQIGLLRDEVQNTSDKLGAMAARLNGLESAVNYSMITGQSAGQMAQEKALDNFRAYNHYLFELGLSFAGDIKLLVSSDMPRNRPGVLEKFIEIDKESQTVKVAGIIYELLDPVFNDYTKCNLMGLLKFAPQSIPAGETDLAGSGLSGILDANFTTIAALGVYYTCSYLGSPVFHLGKNTHLQLDVPPGNPGGARSGIFSSQMKETVYLLWTIREDIGNGAADRIFANAVGELSTQTGASQLDTPLFFDQVMAAAQAYEDGKFAETVKRLIHIQTSTPE